MNIHDLKWEYSLQRRQSGLKTGGHGSGFEDWGSWVRV